MKMAKRRKVIHVESGKVFSTAAEAERAFGLPNSVLSEAIRLGKPCHGEVFKFADDDIVTEVKVSKDKPTKNTDSGNSKTATTTSTKYNGSPTDKQAASEYFNSIGYTTEVVDGVVMFYDCEETHGLAQLVRNSGYDASWGFGPRKEENRSSRYE